MNKLRNNKKGLTALAMLVLVTVIGATFAWFSESVQFQNQFKTGTYETEIEEEFTPPTDWRPGMETSKEVFVTNTGDVPVAVRVKFSDSWYKPEDTLREDMNIFTYESVQNGKTAAEAAIKNFDQQNCTQDEAQIASGAKWYIKYEEIQIEGQTVSVPREAYFLKTLNKGEVTSRVLQSVTMNANIKADKVSEVTPIVEDGKEIGQKVVTKTTSPYSGAKYELTITAETVQADEAAVKEVWADAFGENGSLTGTEQENILKSLGFQSK